MNSLKNGCLKDIFSKNDNLDQIIIQIIDLQTFIVNGQKTYQLIISDGKYWNSLIYLNTDLNQKVKSDNIKKGTIIELQDFDLFVIKSEEKNDETIIMIINRLNIAEKQSSEYKIIGDPKQLITSTIDFLENEISILDYSSDNQSDKKQSHSELNVKTIKDLIPNIKEWTLKARVSEKYPIRKWQNNNGSGNVLNFELIDSTGLIKAVAFRELANHYENIIEENIIYKITNGIIRPVKDEYKNLNINMEILITNDTLIEILIEPEENFPFKTYDFKSISEIKNKSKDENVNLVAICWQIGNLETVTVTSSNRNFVKRDIILIDDTDTLKFTIWNETAEKFEHKIQTVLLIRNARVNIFNETKYITTSNNTIIRINPELKNNKFPMSISLVSICFKENKIIESKS